MRSENENIFKKMIQSVEFCCFWEAESIPQMNVGKAGMGDKSNVVCFLGYIDRPKHRQDW